MVEIRLFFEGFFDPHIVSPWHVLILLFNIHVNPMQTYSFTYSNEIQVPKQVNGEAGKGPRFVSCAGVTCMLIEHDELRRKRWDMKARQGGPERWWQSGVVYQIYPRSFMDSDGDGVGDLRGIVSKLDYLNDGTEKSLGIDAIWLSPIYPSPNKDFGYDISDYRDIDPLYGDMEDFKLLLREAHDRNIRIVMDLVINHTSDQHPWFIEACKSRDNPYHDWYLWHEGKNGKAPNNWFAFFDKKAWWWVDEVRKFYLSTWCRYQPEVNWRNPGLKEAMFDVMRFWLELGVDGYRIDVINWFMKDEQFRSNPFRPQLSPPDLQKHIYDRNRPETHDLCREIREVVDAFPDRFSVGEVYTTSVKDASSYYGNGDELHLAFNFAFLFKKWGAANFLQEIEKWDSLLRDKGWPTYTLSNHDNPGTTPVTQKVTRPTSGHASQPPCS